MPDAASGLDHGQSVRGDAATICAGTAVSAPLLSIVGQLELEFGLVIQPAGLLLDGPHADLGLDRANLLAHRQQWHRHHIDELRILDLTRWLRLDWTLDVRRTFRHMTP